MIATTLAAIAVAGVVLSNAVRAGGDRKVKGRAASVAAPAVKAFAFPEPPPQPTWKGWRVDVRRDVKGTERALHLALAKVLSGMESAPAGRVAYFPSLDHPNYRLDGWHAFVESSSPTPSGVLVTLRVSPLMACTYGASVTVLDCVLERYEVTDGAVRYLDSSEPPGGSSRGVISD